MNELAGAGDVLIINSIIIPQKPDSTIIMLIIVILYSHLPKAFLTFSANFFLTLVSRSTMKAHFSERRRELTSLCLIVLFSPLTFHEIIMES